MNKLVTIAIVGDRDNAITAHRAIPIALANAASALGVDLSLHWLASDAIDGIARLLPYDAFWVAPGSPYRSLDGALLAITHARTSGRPFLGTCGGFQHMVVEFARNAAGITEAAHAETAPGAAVHAVSSLACSLEGEVRQVTTAPGTRVAELCGPGPFAGFHWCNYGVEPAVLDRLVAAGLVVSATAPDAGVEAVELPDHPFYAATLFQPQVGSSETGTLHPLIGALVEAAAGVRSA